MTDKPLLYVNDHFLDVFKSRFQEDYLGLYVNKQTDELQTLFLNPNHVTEMGVTFEYIPLKFESDNPDVTLENIQNIQKSLGFLTPTEAAQEKLWVALLHVYYLDYHMDQLSMIESHVDRSIKSRTVFTSSRKRSLVQNSLSLLWWIGYYTYDEEMPEDPYHLTRFYVDGSYRGNSVGYLSSNIVSNKNTILGSLEAIQELVEDKVIRKTRHAFTETNKLLNQVAGIRLIDALSHQEIYELVKKELPHMEKVVLL